MGVQSLHRRLCEFQFPALSEVVRRSKAHPTVFPIGEPTSGEVRITRMTSHCRGLFLPEAMQPFFKSPHIIVLPEEEGVVKKVEHGKHINSFSNSETMHKVSFEHGKNTIGRTCC